MIELLEKIAKISLKHNWSYNIAKSAFSTQCAFWCWSLWMILSLFMGKFIDKDAKLMLAIITLSIFVLMFYSIYKIMAGSMLLISNDVLTNDDFTGDFAEYNLYDPKIEYIDHNWIVNGHIVIGNISKKIQISFDDLRYIIFIDSDFSHVNRFLYGPEVFLSIRDFIGTTTSALFENDLFIHLVSCGITATDLISQEFLQRKYSLITQLADSTSQDTKLMEFLKNLDELNRIDDGIYDIRFISRLNTKTQKHIFGFISVKDSHHKLDLYLKDHFLELINDFNIYRAEMGWSTLQGSDLIILSEKSDFEFADGSIYFLEPIEKP